MANHSSILPGEYPWTGEAGGLLSIGLQRDRHELLTKQQCMSVSVFNKRLLEHLGKGHVSFCFLYVKFSIVFGSKFLFTEKERKGVGAEGKGKKRKAKESPGLVYLAAVHRPSFWWVRT